MRSISTATQLLANAHAPHTRDALLATLGFPNSARPLRAAARTRLGLPSTIAHAAVARGDGALRALVVELHPNTAHRESLVGIATRLAQRTPHLLWLVLATQKGSSLVAIAAWSHQSPPRVAALVTHRDRIVDSDAETLCALASATALPNDLLQHARWLDTLGRSSITRRFYRTLESQIHALALSLTSKQHQPLPEQARALATLYTSRLLFLAFLETKGWLNGDFGFLINGFATCMASGGQYHTKVLEPLFFGTLNTRPTARATRAHAFGKIPFLNGGLFTRTPLERTFRSARFSDDALGNLYDAVFSRYRFTAREDANTFSEAAIDPEMLGKVFESLMHPPERKRAGAFYTPQTLVEQVTHEALVNALQSPLITNDLATEALAGYRPAPYARGLLLDRIDTIKILDPACGSGAFLVHALERLAAMRAHLGDIRPITDIRRTILTSAIYGVDINPTAVWLCELRLWLSVVIDNTERNPTRILPLPNLDHHIRTGDSLTDGDFRHVTALGTARQLAHLRQQYAKASGTKKKSLARALNASERAHVLAHLDRAMQSVTSTRKEMLCAIRAKDLFARRIAPSATTRRHLTTLRATLHRLRAAKRDALDGAALPFAFPSHFPDVAAAGGFSVVLGNPPWVRLHHVPKERRVRFKESFDTFRNAPWYDGAANAHAAPGFAAQVDLAALFVERAVHLLADQGTLALLLPSKLWHALAGGGVRRLLARHTHVTALHDFSTASSAFEAATYPSLVVATKHAHPETAEHHTMVTVHHTRTRTQWIAPTHTIPLTPDPDSPWIIAPPNARHAFDAITRSAIPLSRSPLGHPILGVKTGCNAAFVVTEDNADDDALPNSPTRITALHETHPPHALHTAHIERHMLRPLVRGESITPWSLTPTNTRIVWTHDEHSARPYNHLPPHTERWLHPWRHRLTRRTDARHRTQWWMLFRTDAARSELTRVVWNDLGRSPRAAVIPANDPTVPLNSCYALHCADPDDAYALATLMNSPLIAAYLALIAEPARNGYRRFLGWTVALLPIPKEWPRARTLLAPIARHAAQHAPPSDQDLLEASLLAFKLALHHVQPLLDWHTQHAFPTPDPIPSPPRLDRPSHTR